MFYIIDSRAIFHPEQNLITDLHKKKEVSVFSPASRCLQSLIEEQGKILGQKELMALGWENQGLTVSPNAFYQNISHIRKALAEVLVDSEIIKTVKRAGWTIEDSLKIERITDDMLSEEAEENIITHTDPPEDLLEPVPSSTVAKKNSQIHQSIIFCIISLIVANTWYGFHMMKPKVILFNNYKLERTVPCGCELYVNNDAGKSSVQNNRLPPTSRLCKGFDKVYLTQWDKRLRFSLIFCSKVSSIVNTNSLVCSSEYYGKDQP